MIHIRGRNYSFLVTCKISLSNFFYKVVHMPFNVDCENILQFQQQQFFLLVFFPEFPFMVSEHFKREIAG